MGLPSTPYFLCFHYFGSATVHFHFFTSYTTHGLLFLSFRAPLSPFTSSRSICLSHGPVIHYSCHLGLMGFQSVCQLLSIRVVGLLLPFLFLLSPNAVPLSTSKPQKPMKKSNPKQIKPTLHSNVFFSSTRVAAKNHTLLRAILEAQVGKRSLTTQIERSWQTD